MLKLRYDRWTKTNSTVVWNFKNVKICFGCSNVIFEARTLSFGCVSTQGLTWFQFFKILESLLSPYKCFLLESQLIIDSLWPKASAAVEILKIGQPVQELWFFEIYFIRKISSFWLFSAFHLIGYFFHCSKESKA